MEIVELINNLENGCLENVPVVASERRASIGLIFPATRLPRKVCNATNPKNITIVMVNGYKNEKFRFTKPIDFINEDKTALVTK